MTESGPVGRYPRTRRKRSLHASGTTVSVLLLFGLSSAHAQVRNGPAGFQDITAEAAIESLAVLRDLDTEIRRRPRDAALWYRRGMLAWALAARDNVPPGLASLDWTLLGAAADSSLRIAASIDPSRVEYRLSSGLYLASSFGGVNRTAALEQYHEAIKVARKLPDHHRRAAALVTAGRTYWRFYDSLEELDYANANAMTSAAALGEAARGSYAMSAHCTMGPNGQIFGCVTTGGPEGSNRGSDYRGEYYYLRSEALFREAYSSDPTASETFINLVRLLIARNRWYEASGLARARIQTASADPWGWFVLGLTQFRMGDIHRPQASFDSALARLNPATRSRLDRVERVLRSRDSLALSTRSPAAKRAWEDLYWRIADPMWSLKGNEPRTEFLARIAYAELRWTMEETGQIGAETERGEAYVRYGPPAKIRSWVDTMRMSSAWSGKYHFYFNGFDRLRFEDPGIVRARFEDTPVYWVGLRPLYVDSMATQVVRFRATPDSADVLIAQTAPTDRYTNASISPPPPTAYLWITPDGINNIAHDSVATDPLKQSVFSHRVPRGSFLVRTETSSEQSDAAGRATSVLTIADTSSGGFALRGSGLSDLMFGRGSADNPHAGRWSDVDVIPLSGALVRGEELALIWENYDFAADSGTARYAIKIVIERDRSSPGGIMANIVRGIAGAVGVHRDENTLEMSFDRTVAHAPVLVDNLSIDLGETPNGRYRLSVTVTDKGSGRTFHRTGTFAIRE